MVGIAEGGHDELGSGLLFGACQGALTKFSSRWRVSAPCHRLQGQQLATQSSSIASVVGGPALKGGARNGSIAVAGPFLSGHFRVGQDKYHTHPPPVPIEERPPMPPEPQPLGTYTCMATTYPTVQRDSVQTPGLVLTFQIQIRAALADRFTPTPDTESLFLLLHDPQTSRAVRVVRPVSRVPGLAALAVVSLPVPELHNRRRKREKTSR